MSASKDLQEAVAAALEASGLLPEGLAVIRRREKELLSDLESGDALATGMTLFVMPPLGTSTVQGVPFLFFDRFEVRVTITEFPTMNEGPDIWEVMELVAGALHWQPKDPESPLAQMLSHPLAIAARPFEMDAGRADMPGFSNDKQFVRVVDVIFNAVMQVNPAA